jgi:predicted RNase H-like HicB family nuclease/predicted RNA binding protein YcfA (HicA-like mRNA interferase family)
VTIRAVLDSGRRVLDVDCRLDLVPQLTGCFRPRRYRRRYALDSRRDTGTAWGPAKVRSMIPALERDGWSEVGQVVGSHRQFSHLRKRGRITVPATLDDELAPGTMASLRRAAGLPPPSGRRMAMAPERTDLGYVVIVEPTRTGYSAYVPNLPGCITVGRTRVEIKRQMSEAIALHLAGIRGDRAQIPQPAAIAAILVVPRAVPEL